MRSAVASRAASLLVTGAVAALLLAPPSLARAEAGCMVSGICTGAGLAGADLGPCDRTCTTGLCADGRCLDPEVCSTLCASRGCPTVTVGNQELTPTGMGCSYLVEGCFGGQALVFGEPSALVPAGCFAGALSSVGWLTGDCDHDGISNLAEGRGQLCVDQLYVSAPSADVTTTTRSCDDESCTRACSPSGLPHEGLVCGTSTVAYACTEVADCPSTSASRARHCVASPSGAGLCVYRELCLDPAACIDFASLPAGLEEAFANGNCDGDTLPNRRDRFDCGTAGVVVWPEGASPAREERPECGVALCGALPCDPAGLCIGENVIGLACATGIGFLCEAGGDCVPVGAAGVETCVPPTVDRSGCATLGPACFRRDVELALRFEYGDCDDDGIPNVAEAAGRVCAADLDAGPGADAGGAAPFDAGDARSDAGSISLDGGPPAAPPRFAGSGCACRARSGPMSAASPALALLALLALLAAAARRAGTIGRR